MRRFVLPGPLVPGEAVELPAQQRHHLLDVLRLEVGTQFIGLDPEGKPFILRLETAAGRALVLGLAPSGREEPRTSIRLYLPLLKGDKLDWVVQKSVELGVAAISLYRAKRSVVSGGNLDKKIARWEKIALEATQQCRRRIVPPIAGLFTLEEVAAAAPGLFAWEEEEQQSLGQSLGALPGLQVPLLTGPEGGLTTQEAELLTHYGWTAVSLGPRILRAETAPIVMAACTLFARGEMD